METLPNVTLMNGNIPYEPIARIYSRQQQTSTSGTPTFGPHHSWKHCLGFTPTHVINKTLSATTQMIPSVEAETREIMRDHFTTRLPELKVQL